MTKSWHIDRRAVLKGVGASLALPLLECMASGTEKTELPRRFCSIYFPFGVSLPGQNHKDAAWNWFPKGAGRDYTFGHSLSHLQDMRHKLTVMSGLSHPAARAIGGHHSANTFLTGAHLKQTGGPGNSISIDQYAAGYLGKHTRHQSLVLAADSGIGTVTQTKTLSFDKNGQGIPSLSSPRFIYDILFNTSSGPIKARRDKLDRDVNTLDSILEHSKSLQRRLGKQDLEKLEEYLTSIRSLEKRLNHSKEWLDVPTPKVDAKSLALDIDINSDEEADPLEYYECIFDLMAIALQTDSTRLLTFMTGTNHAGASIADGFTSRLGIGKGGHHAIAHNSERNPKAHGQVDKFLAERFGYFIRKLDAMKEHGSSVLDRTIVLYGSSNSRTHVNHNYPLILAGGNDFGIPHEQFVKCSSKTPLSNMFVSIMDKLNIPGESFKDSTGDMPQVFNR